MQNNIKNHTKYYSESDLSLAYFEARNIFLSFFVDHSLLFYVHMSQHELNLDELLTYQSTFMQHIS